ncbi:MAG: hypothetical protein P1V51_22375 [Deltaproteobacteria bacterium]|nr:hypothetical protein [Deltaproteobacteria bacterium]
MPGARQASFAGGEISPRLFGRTDVARYAHSLRRCENMLVTPTGAALNRPGFEYLGDCKNNSAARLIPFFYSDGSAYVLELGSGYLRIWKDGVQVENPPGTPVEVATPWLAGDLPYLMWCQINDVMYLCDGAAASPSSPYKLTRTSDTAWTLVVLNPPMSGPAAPAVAPVHSTTPASPVNQTVSDVNQERDYRWVYTNIDPNGKESTSNAAPLISSVRIEGDGYVILLCTRDSSLINKVALYRAEAGGPYGFITEESVTSTGVGSTKAVKDFGSPPDYTRQPPTARDPIYQEYHRAVALFQQRLVFGGAPENTGSDFYNSPQTLHLSTVGDIETFDTFFPVEPDHPMELTIGSTRREVIQALVPLGRHLLILTDAGAWTLDGAGGALAPASFDLQPQDYAGAAPVMPVVVGNNVLYVQARGSGIRDIKYDYQVGGYRGADVTTLAHHLFDGHSIVQLTYQEKPHHVLWALRDDGALLGFTYLPEQEVWAWHRHAASGWQYDVSGTLETQSSGVLADGAIRAICVVPEGTEDALYVITRRKSGEGHYLERMASRRVPNIRQGIFLDSALRFDGRATPDDGTMTIQNYEGLTAGDRGEVLAGVSSFVAGDVGDWIVFEPDSTSRVCRLEITGYISAFLIEVRLLDDCQDATPGYDWAWGRASFSGLDHLEGETVNVLADGAVATELPVKSGAVGLATPAVDVVIGLAYVSQIELLDLPPAQFRDRAEPKALSGVTVEVEDTRAFSAVTREGEVEGGGYFEQAESDVGSVVKREAAAETVGYMSLPREVTGAMRVELDRTWNVTARPAILQTEPIPLAVLAVTREFAGG